LRKGPHNETDLLPPQHSGISAEGKCPAPFPHEFPVTKAFGVFKIEPFRRSGVSVLFMNDKRTFFDLAILVILFMAAASLVEARPFTLGKPLDVTVTRTSEGKFRVRLGFAGDPSGTTELRLPNEWGGQKELFKAIRNLNVLTRDTELTDTEEQQRKQLTHKPGQRIVIEYDVAQDFEGPLRNSHRYRPVTASEYFHWIGYTFWVLPAWNDEESISANVEWKGLPKSWNVATSFGSGRTQKFRTRMRELKRSIGVGGDFRIVTGNAAGKPVRVAVRGTWEFTDAELAAMARRVIEIQRDFWNDHTQENYLVTLVPIAEGPGAISIGGTGLADSFALFATENVRIERLRGILAHEYFHNWNPPKLGRMPEPEQQMYWFSEGFTEYYTYVLLHRGGLINEAEMAGQFNDLIREYYLSPHSTEPNERIVRDFWSDGRVQRLPYLRGFMLAMNWNAAIKQRSENKHSLDDVMHDLLRSSAGGSRELSAEAVAAHIERYLDRSVAPEMAKFISYGELISPDASALGPGWGLELAETAVFELGFDLDAFQASREFTGVVPGTAAYEAGLRNGQRLAGGLSVSLGNTTKEVEIKVLSEEGEKMIRYLPVARKRIPVPQFVRSDTKQ
jgi:predicted metalloprotease with PDZ domain